MGNDARIRRFKELLTGCENALPPVKRTARVRPFEDERPREPVPVENDLEEPRICDRKPKSQRLYGKIKWFGGQHGERDYGFVHVSGGQDLFVHASQCKCDTKLLLAGTVVTFEQSLNPRNGKPEARWLRLLEDERSPTIIESCLADPDVAYSRPAWCAKVDRMNREEALAAFRLRREDILKNHKAYTPRIADPILSLPELNWLRDVLPRKRHIALCLSALDQSTNAEEEPVAVCEELAGCMFSDLHWQQDVDWSDVPDHVLANEAFVKSIAEQMSKMPENADAASSGHLSHPVDRSRAVHKMPILLKSNSIIFRLLPPSEQAEYCWDCSISELHDKWGWMSESGRIELIVRAVSEGKMLDEFHELIDDRLIGMLPTNVQVGAIWDLSSKQLLCHWLAFSEEARVRALYRAHVENTRLKEFADLPVEGIQYETIHCLILGSQQAGERQSFTVSHDKLQAHVIEHAWSSPDPLRFDAILPACCFENNSKVPYCEGRAWFTEDEKEGAARASRAFCPRTGRECFLSCRCPPDGCANLS